MWIMIAGPYRSGSFDPEVWAENLRALNRAAVEVLLKGHLPVIGVNMALPVIEAAGEKSYNDIMMPLSLGLTERCDAVLRIGGASKGADEEVERFRARGLPIFRSVEEIEADRPVLSFRTGNLPSSFPTSRSMDHTIELRNVSEHDIPIFFEHQLDPAAVHMAAFTVKDPADEVAFTDRWNRLMADDSIVKYTILYDGKVVGNVICFLQFGLPSVGYWIDRNHWGKGIATEALAELLRRVGVRPLHARAAADNLASIRVLEKCGFAPLEEQKGFAEARGEMIDEVLMRLDA